MSALFHCLVDKACKPKTDLFKEPLEFEITYQRNKTVLFIQVFSFFTMVAYIAITNKVPTDIQKVSFLCISVILSVFLLTCRTHPNLFKAFYFCFVTFFGPVSLHYDSNSIFFNFIGVYILPTWILFVSGSRKLFFCEMLIQLSYLNILYKPALFFVLDRMTNDTFILRICNITSFGVFINSIFLLTTQIALYKAQSKVSASEMRHKELERQRIFLLGFSHELRNLLNSLIGNIQLCTLESVSEKVSSLLHNSQVCGELLLHLVTNILDTGKAEIGDLEVNPVPNDIYDSLEKVWSVCSQLLKDKRLRGKMNIKKNMPNILRFDNYRLTQILMNLIGNAIKYTDHGSVNVSVEWIDGPSKVSPKCFEPTPFDDDGEGQFERQQRTVSLRNDITSMSFDSKRKPSIEEPSPVSSSGRGILKITVADTGVGIQPEKLKNLFQRFNQIQSNLSTKKLGTGLGLYVTQQLVSAMHGSIQPYSRPGEGTVFIACLPVEVEPRDVSLRVSMDYFMTTLDTLDLNAIIVDDVEFNITILKNYFTRLNINVLDVARNGKEAVEKYKSHILAGNHIDVVTMDVEMPVMDGKDAVKLIRRFERERGIEGCLLTMVSGNCSHSEMSQCIDVTGKNGANNFLKKPVTMDDLAKVIKLRFETKMRTIMRINSMNSATPSLQDRIDSGGISINL